ncbi:FAD-dependent oxidoreductase [Thalassotalea sp. PS06]|nr:FAD-dependent oxidoreductase [Thalassotalea sp. PS06]
MKGFGFLVLLAVLYISWVFIDTALNRPQPVPPSTTVNDITGLNSIAVNSVIAPTSLNDIVNSVKTTSGKISIGGGRYSQGGQIATENSLHLDMRQFNQVLNLNADKKLVTVQSGITWRDLQSVLDEHDLSVKIMQSYANFTVGGSLSVNVHGRYMGEGPIIRSVQSIKLVLADGQVIEASQTVNPELFFATIGGYGGIGIIGEVTLHLEDNTRVKRSSTVMDIADYPNYFKNSVLNDGDIVFHNADIYPPNYQSMRAVNWSVTDQQVTQSKRLVDTHQQYILEPALAELVARHDSFKWARQYLLEPILYRFDTVHWRNYEASYDVNQLEPNSREDYTYVLREYFVPVENFATFTESMADIFQLHQVNVLNVSVRHALPDTGSMLAWADNEVFAFVVYYRQGTSEAAQQKVATWSREMIDSALDANGSYYLPYQLHASDEQFARAYPKAKEYLKVKQAVDPKLRFSNKLLERHFISQINNLGSSSTDE